MASGVRYCRHCLGALRSSIYRASATRPAGIATSARHYSLSPPPRQTIALQRNALQPRSVRHAPESTTGSGLARQVAHFSVSSIQRKAILNPRKDEEGNDMTVDITARAANRLKAIMEKEGNQELALRVTVESGGCHGFQYLMSLTDMSKVDAQEDTVFEGDKGARVVMDEPSLDLLKGSKVDYTMELIGSQFKIVDNPLATSSCGCGTSFDIKAV